MAYEGVTGVFADRERDGLTLESIFVPGDSGGREWFDAPAKNMGARMSENMPIDLAQLSQRISELEQNVERIIQNEGRWSVTNMLHPVSTNLSNIREMLLLEIIREKGLLDGIDIDKVAQKARDQYATGTAPWGASEEAALKNLKTALRELQGDYKGE